MKLKILMILVISIFLSQLSYARHHNAFYGKIERLTIYDNSANTGTLLGVVGLDVDNPDTSCITLALFEPTFPDTTTNRKYIGWAISNTVDGARIMAILVAAKLNGTPVSISTNTGTKGTGCWVNNVDL